VEEPYNPSRGADVSAEVCSAFAISTRSRNVHQIFRLASLFSSLVRPLPGRSAWSSHLLAHCTAAVQLCGVFLLGRGCVLCACGEVRGEAGRGAHAGTDGRTDGRTQASEQSDPTTIRRGPPPPGGGLRGLIIIQYTGRPGAGCIMQFA
jgi:hypothetical protein